MPEPKFLLGANVRLGVDTLGALPKEMEGKIVQIDNILPFDEVHNAFYYDVHLLIADMTARVHEDYIETMLL